MGKIASRKPVKLIIGFIFKDDADFEKARRILLRRFGQIDFQSQPLSFDRTNYYKDEMGDSLKRIFVSFKRLIYPQDLTAIKNFTNKIESRLSRLGKRCVNIDPGYVDLPKLVLASTKDYVHRIYLNKGIYAELTLLFQGKSFSPWQWTYPDYRSSEYIQTFNGIRELLAKQLKEY
jgi:hypothetical protein